MIPEVSNGSLVPLDTLAKEINACHDKAEGYDKKAADFRATRDQKIVEAHGRIKGGEIVQTFEDWCEENLTITNRMARKIVRRLTGPELHVTNAEPVPEPEGEDDQPTLVEVWPKPRKNLVREIYDTVINTLTVDQMIELTKLLITECNEAQRRRAGAVTLESVQNLLKEVDAA